MRLPRFLWVPFELGRPFGAPHEPEFQRRVLHDALALLERSDGPVVLEDFPDDAPANPTTRPSGRARSPSAPLATTSLTRPGRHGPELRQLAPWAELGRRRYRTAGGRRTRSSICSPPRPKANTLPFRTIRLAADDLRTWYLHAAAQQPGRATSHERNTWFWRETALARLLGQMTARLLDDPDPTMRMFADRGLVPRDHFDFLVPRPPAKPNPTEHPMPEPRTIIHEPLSGPAVWRGPELDPSDYLYQLDPTEIDEICRVRDDLLARDVSLGAVDPESAPMPALA